MLRFLARFDTVPRRVIYIVLFIACASPFLMPIRLPLNVWDETRNSFEVTQNASPDKVIAICSNWDPGSEGENWPQYEALVAHCMLTGKKFVVFSVDSDPISPQLAENINLRQAKRYGKKYGRDWVNLGLSRGIPLVMGAIGRNVKAAYPHDFHNNSTLDYEKLPLMRQIHDVRDFSCFWVVEYEPNLSWVVFLDPTSRIPIVFACAGMVSTGFYPYVSSGQLKGMVVGNRGAAEYESMLRDKFGNRFDESDLRGQKLLVPQAFGYLVIILFILAGNLGMIAKRRLNSKKPLGGK